MAPEPPPAARDLATGFPRSPRDTLAGYVIVARTLDKCRAAIAGTAGEYHFDCPLDRQFFDFTGIDSGAFREFVATGADDERVAEWIAAHARPRPRREIILWNNRMRDLRLSDLPAEAQEYMEDYIARFIPPGRPIYRWFDVYDIEEQRL